MVDCDTQNHGCQGGVLQWAYSYTASNHLETETDYPYTGKDGTCKFTKSKGRVGATGYKNVAQNSQSQLRAAANIGPVSVAIEADKSVFQTYKSGVLSSNGCGTKLDHGVLVVGYGRQGLHDYYIVKNSWGPTWGDSGYIKIAGSRSGPGTCGIQMGPVYPSGTN